MSMMSTNEARFVRLYWKYQNLIMHVAYNRLHDYHLAQDVCQETFLRMFGCVDLSMAEEAIKGWLIVVADNLSKDILRKDEKYQHSEELNQEEAGVLQVRVSGDDYLEEMARKDLRAEILESLYEYNREEYEIVLLVCCLQMPLADAARQMNMTYEQISMKLHRARRWIRNHFSDEYRGTRH